MAPCKSVILTEGLPWVKNIKSNQIKSYLRSHKRSVFTKGATEQGLVIMGRLYSFLASLWNIFAGANNIRAIIDPCKDIIQGILDTPKASFV